MSMHTELKLPDIISGGRGIYGSSWEEVKRVSMLGGIGVVSGASMDNILLRILQSGDLGHHYKRAIDSFPDQAVAQRVYKRYYVSGGIPETAPFKKIENISLKPSPELIELIIVANYCQVWLAGEGHDGLIGINLLEKIQIPHLWALYGAMLTGRLAFLFVGAGLPIQFPAILDSLTKHQKTTYEIDVDTDFDIDALAWLKKWTLKFNPREYINCSRTELKRPLFFPIISSAFVLKVMLRQFHTKNLLDFIDGISIEDPTYSGGHQARDRAKDTTTVQPVYIKGKDYFSEADYKKLQDMKLPFYIAGACASPEMLKYAKSIGAVGVQVGSIIDLAEDSGRVPVYRKKMRRRAYLGECIKKFIAKIKIFLANPGHDLELIRGYIEKFNSIGSKISEEKTLSLITTEIETFLAKSKETPSHNNEESKKKFIDKLESYIPLYIINSRNASPTGYPFRIVIEPGTLGDPATLITREPRCISGGLLVPYLKKSAIGKTIIGIEDIGYRCASEPPASFVAKGGNIEKTAGKICLCEGLGSGAGLAQRISSNALGKRDGLRELPVFTLGSDLSFLLCLMSDENGSYTIFDAFKYILSEDSTALKKLHEAAGKL